MFHAYRITRFYILVFIALWLDMLTISLCLLSLNIATVVTENYLDRATQKGLDYVRELGVPFLEKELLTLNVPDVRGVTKTPVGVISYELTSIRIKDISISNSNITVDPKAGLTVRCQNGQIGIVSRWKYKENNWPHIKDSGSVNLLMRHINLKITLYIDSKNEKKPSVETRECSLKIGSVNLQFHGGASWLYNLFANTIASELKSTIANEVCRAVSRMIDEQGDKLLQQIPDIIHSIKTHVQMFSENMPENAD